MRKLIHSLSAALLAAALLLSCPVRAADPVRIGVFGPLFGDAAAMGNSAKDAVELAVKEQNAAAGLLGAPVESVPL